MLFARRNSEAPSALFSRSTFGKKKWAPQSTLRCLCLPMFLLHGCSQPWSEEIRFHCSLSFSLSLLCKILFFSPYPISVNDSLTWVFAEIQVLNVQLWFTSLQQPRYPPTNFPTFSNSLLFLLLHCDFCFLGIPLVPPSI